jgi:hypothetical protein
MINAEPLAVYWGSDVNPKELEGFQGSKGESTPGHFVTDDSDTAEGYAEIHAERSGKHPRVYSVTLKPGEAFLPYSGPNQSDGLELASDVDKSRIKPHAMYVHDEWITHKAKSLNGFHSKAARKGTCKQGERADLTGCVPASDETIEGRSIREGEQNEYVQSTSKRADTAAEQLEFYLAQGVVIGGSGPWLPESKYPNAKYRTAKQYVQDQGQKFLGSLLPEGVERGEPQACFMNATQLVVQNPSWKYAEGYAMREGLMPVLHAWAVTEDGEVVDNTWDEPENSAYLGVVYDRSQYMRYIFKAKFYGILGGANKNAEKIVAKGGL